MERENQISTAHLIVKAIEGFSTVKSTRSEEKNQLAEDIKTALNELENIRNYFEVVDEPELIDYAIYREKAALLRLSYLLKKAKKNNEMVKSSIL
jgi:DNA-binding protein H-NS